MNFSIENILFIYVIYLVYGNVDKLSEYFANKYKQINQKLMLFEI